MKWLYLIWFVAWLGSISLMLGLSLVILVSIENSKPRYTWLTFSSNEGFTDCVGVSVHRYYQDENERFLDSRGPRFYAPQARGQLQVALREGTYEVKVDCPTRQYAADISVQPKRKK